MRVYTKSLRSRTGGFTLLEVLIALVVLSIGLLGLAGMQLTGMQSNQDGYLRSQAVAIAYDMADRIRANPTGMKNSLYDNISVDNSSSPTTPTCGTTSACTDSTGAGMATLDLFQWAQYFINPTLPGGVGTVECNIPGSAAVCAPNNACACTISVQWNERARTQQTATTSSFALAMQLQ